MGRDYDVGRIRPYFNLKDGKPKEYEENIHHILPQSRLGANVEQNKIKLYIAMHDPLHRLFGNGTPQEQIKQLLFINSKALTNEFTQDILNILQEEDPDYYYKNGVYLKK